MISVIQHADSPVSNYHRILMVHTSDDQHRQLFSPRVQNAC